VRLPRVTDRYSQEMASQSRRITGVTPGVTQAFMQKPWRYLAKSRGLQTLARGGVKQKGKF
jgi:hypothetical protein